MKIVSIDIYQIGAQGANKTVKFRPVVIKINTDEGICGFGEAGLAYGKGSTAGVGMVQDMAGLVIGADPFKIEELWEKLFRKTFWGMGGGSIVFGAISAIDTACWDIKGKAFGVPVYQLLGGRTREKVRSYASQIQFDWGKANKKALVEPREYADAAARAVAEGFDCVKVDPVSYTAEGIWAGADLGGILTHQQITLFANRVKAIREAVGPNVDIIIEIHSYLSVYSAIQFARAIEDYNCLFYEEPIHPLNADNMAQVARSVKIPLASGERIYSRWGYRPFFEKQALAVIQPDLGLVGGISEGKKICDYAHIYDVTVQCHVCGSPLATAIALQLEAVIPNFIIHEFHANAMSDTNIAICKYPYLPQNGYLEIPDRPGIGQELSEKVMRESLILRAEG
jgi:galactonate dehydratase